MDLIVLGFNFKTHSIHEREAFNLRQEYIPAFRRALLDQDGVHGVVYLETCHRVEIYLALEKKVELLSILDLWKTFLNSFASPVFPGYLYKNGEAFLHLLKVASGLDSMVVGETQVLGQVKKAYFDAMAHHTTGALINFVFQQCFRFAKQIRFQTGISQYPVSVCSVVMMLLDRVFGQFQNLKILILGLGEIGCEAAQFLSERKVGQLYLFNRTKEKAEIFAKQLLVPTTICEEKDLDVLFGEVDALISCMSVTQFILSQKQWEEKNRKKVCVCIDLGLPRNMDPDIGKCNHVYLYNVDDLRKITEENLGHRREEAEKASILLAKYLDLFEREWIKRVQRYAEGELARAVSSVG